jgi:hypothetical protein
MREEQRSLVGGVWSDGGARGDLNPYILSDHRNLNSLLALLSDITLGVIMPLSTDNTRSAAQTVTSRAT